MTPRDYKWEFEAPRSQYDEVLEWLQENTESFNGAVGVQDRPPPYTETKHKEADGLTSYKRVVNPSFKVWLTDDNDAMLMKLRFGGSRK